jgi:hypothetical protein
LAEFYPDDAEIVETQSQEWMASIKKENDEQAVRERVASHIVRIGEPITRQDIEEEDCGASRDESSTTTASAAGSKRNDMLRVTPEPVIQDFKPELPIDH